MIGFTLLHLSDDRKTLCIDCRVDDKDAFSGVFISKVSIDWYGNYNDGTPSDKAIAVYTNTDNDSTVKSVSIDVIESQLGTKFGTTKFAGELFYVYVEWGGTYDASQCACGEDNTYIIGIVPDWKAVYDEGMSYIREIVDAGPCGCSPDSSFTDFVLRWNALKLAVASCDYPLVKKLWEDLFTVTKNVAPVGGCNCKNS